MHSSAQLRKERPRPSDSTCAHTCQSQMAFSSPSESPQWICLSAAWHLCHCIRPTLLTESFSQIFSEMGRACPIRIKCTAPKGNWSATSPIGIQAIRHSVRQCFGPWAGGRRRSPTHAEVSQVADLDCFPACHRAIVKPRSWVAYHLHAADIWAS